MRILIVGNPDISGQAIATRLYKEGNKIFWLTEAVSENIYADKKEGKVYRENIEMSRIKSIFKANSIDTVIFLGVSYFHQKVAHTREKGYMLPKLSNVLSIAHECEVKSFLFVSDLAVLSEKGENDIYLEATEDICKTYKDKMNLGILRLPMVYGETLFEQMGYFGELFEKIVKEEEVSIPFKAESFVDVFDARDIADAVYRVLVQNLSGTFNIGSSERISLTQLINILCEAVSHPVKVTYGEKNYIMANDENVLELKNVLGWNALHSLKNEKKVLQQIISKNSVTEVVEKNEEKVSKLPQSVKVTLENLILFIIVCGISSLISAYADFRYIDIKLVYVVMIAAFYGKTQSAIAMVLACLHQAWSIYNAGIDISYLIYSVESWTPFAMYILGGSTIGYLFDKKKDEYESLKNDMDLLNEKYYFLKDVYKDVCDVKDHLQKQIVVSKDSFGRVFEITKELDSFHPELIFFKTVNIMENIMEVSNVSIYTINNGALNYARLIAHSASLAGNLSASINFDDYPELKKSVVEGKLFVNKELLPNYPAYAAPVMDGETIIAIIVIHEVEYLKFTQYYQNLFQIVCGLVQSNVVRAYNYSKQGLTSRYIEGTIILKPQELEKYLKVVEEAKEKIQLSYIKCKLECEEKLSLAEVSTKVSKLLRNTDFIGVDEEGNYYIVFMQAGKDVIRLLHDRFAKHNLTLEVLS